MYRQFYEGMTWSDLPLFTLVLFVSIFLAVVVRLFVLHRGRDYESMARMPIDGGNADG